MYIPQKVSQRAPNLRQAIDDVLQHPGVEVAEALPLEGFELDGGLIQHA